MSENTVQGLPELDYTPFELFQRLKEDDSVEIPREEREMLADMLYMMLGY